MALLSEAARRQLTFNERSIRTVAEGGGAYFDPRFAHIVLRRYSGATPGVFDLRCISSTHPSNSDSEGFQLVV
jgi:hypothetical protein